MQYPAVIDLFVSTYRELFSIVGISFSIDRDTKMAVFLSPICNHA